MSGSATLPPQAYTREVLVKAYEWLSTQDPVVRDRATTADAMVALYSQARRRHQMGDETPGRWESPSVASVEAFKADLRNLAEGLRQFDDPSAPPPAPTMSPGPSNHATPHRSQVPPLRSPQFYHPDPSPPLPSFHDDWNTPEFQPTSAKATAAPLTTDQLAVRPPSSSLDAKSQAWVDEIRRRMNLSSEGDALRAIIAVGYERLRDLLPRT